MNENKKNLENTLDFYNEKMTKKAVGKLFQEYMEEGEENYFITDEEYEDSEFDNEDNQNYNRSYNKSYNKDYSQNQNHSQNQNEKKSFYVEFENNDFQNENFQDDGFQEEYYDDSGGNSADEYSDLNNNINYKKDNKYNNTVKTYSPRRKRSAKSPKSKSKRVYTSSSTNSKKKIQKSGVKKPKKRVKKEEYIEKDYYDDYENKPKRFIAVFLGLFSFALLVTVAVLSYKLNLVSGELSNMSERLNQEIDNPSNAEELNSLTAQVESLTKENEELKRNSGFSQTNKASNENAAVNSSENNKNAENSSADTNENTNNTNNSNNSNENNENNGNNDSTPSSYTVEKGDNAWKISQKVYGKGDYYTKILEANNLEDAASLTVGQELIIPKI